MPDQTALARYEAQQQVEHFVNRHRLNSFRDASNEEFVNHANCLKKYLDIIYGGDVAQVSEAMRAIAAEIAEAGRYDPFPDGHHDSAAATIRMIAENLELDACPWRDLIQLLRGSSVKRKLAHVLWDENLTRDMNWSVSLEVVSERVWGDSVTSENTIRVNVSRLSDWLSERGITNQFSVNASDGRPQVACTIICVDEERIKTVTEQDSAERLAAAERSPKKSMAKVADVSRESVADLVKKIKPRGPQ